MTDLQKEFEATRYTSWINLYSYPVGKTYTQEYIMWLEKQVLALRQPPVVGQSEQLCPKCGSDNLELTDDNENLCNYCENVWA